MPIAKDSFPEADFLKLPVIDTLFLSPLAFPENPYHKLVKDYKLLKICRTGLEKIWEDYAAHAAKRPVLAYVLSWIMVSGGNSIIPPWVKHEFPGICNIIRKLRYSCGDEACEFCKEHNDSEKLLKKYFGFEKYRALPDGRVLQKEIIDSNLI